jgi:hypothetical protein
LNEFEIIACCNHKRRNPGSMSFRAEHQIFNFKKWSCCSSVSAMTRNQSLDLADT